MSGGGTREKAPETDRRRGLVRGRPVAHVVESEDGWTILVGRTAADNDLLTFKLGRPYDFWLHVAADSGSHVVVLNDERAKRLPRATRDLAAALAAGHSRGRDGGSTPVHLAACGDVFKPRGAPPGRVSLRRHSTVTAQPRRVDSL